MSMTAEEQNVQTLDIRNEELVNAPIEIVFQAMLDELGPEAQMMDGKAMPMTLEAWPGGRWYRDLGNNAGHFWGHVQVIKPPALLEICGPMPMSYPASNFIQYRLSSEGNGTRIKFTHRAIGLIPQEHRDGMPEGWTHWIKRMRERAEAKKGAGKSSSKR
jgi:uncharacterized protein YndB with AHSA1/START domain